MQLVWKASESVTALHAALAMAQGHAPASRELAERMQPVIDAFPAAMREQRERVLAMLTQQAAVGFEQNHQLAQQSLHKLWGAGGQSELSASELAAWVSSAESTFYTFHRERNANALVDEIRLRSGPMKDQWEARGPGMLRAFSRLTEPWLLAERAEVVMVLPVVGGYGLAHLLANVVTLEAVLTDVDESLPEVVRLGWLLSQLQFDLPAIAEHVAAERLAELAQLASLPPMLAAAEEVELVRAGSVSIERALLLWRVANSDAEAERLAGVVGLWWDTYIGNPVAWPAAVAALEQMLAEKRP